MSDKLKICQLLLKKERATNAKFNAEISLLKKKQYISWNETKFPNVINANFFINLSYGRWVQPDHIGILVYNLTPGTTTKRKVKIQTEIPSAQILHEFVH